jgi:hypothetical protein
MRHGPRTEEDNATLNCDGCELKSVCCPKVPFRRIPRDIHERARDVARSFADTEASNHGVNAKRSRCGSSRGSSGRCACSAGRSSAAGRPQSGADRAGHSREDQHGSGRLSSCKSRSKLRPSCSEMLWRRGIPVASLHGRKFSVHDLAHRRHVMDVRIDFTVACHRAVELGRPCHEQRKRGLRAELVPPKALSERRAGSTVRRGGLPEHPPVSPPRPLASTLAHSRQPKPRDEQTVLHNDMTTVFLAARV